VPQPGSVVAVPRVEAPAKPPETRRWVSATVYVLGAAVLFLVYLRLSNTGPENSDMANILLMASDMLHGNAPLHGWYMSDVSFYTTELPQYAMLEFFFGVHPETAHIAAAMTYTLAVLLAVALVRSKRRTIVPALIAVGIMLAPQLGNGVYALDTAVGHIGTSVPLLLIFLFVDRARPRWWVPPVTAVLLAWVLVADPVVEIAALVPLAVVGLARAIQQAGQRQARDGAVWYDLALAAAAPAALELASLVERLLRDHGGYVVNPLPFHLRTLSELNGIPRGLWQVLELFGADFAGLSGVSLLLAIGHLVSVALVVAAMLRTAGRFFRGAARVDQLLLIAIAGSIAAYLLTTVSVEGAHEIAFVTPFAAALTGRMLPDLALRRAAPRRAMVVGALVLAGYAAGLGYEISQPYQPAADSRLASWLCDHHLGYGLSGYWDSSIVTVDSGGCATVRAVTAGTMQPDLWMADEAWYEHDARFLVLGPQSSWPTSAIYQRFGKPARVYHTGPYTVMVWDHNLL
jgi:hypothetical protein